MPRPKSTTPKHCHHKSTNRGFVRLSGEMKYTGTWGTQQSRDEYLRLLGEWIARGRQALRAAGADADGGPLVEDVIAQYWIHAQEYYRNPASGSLTTETESIKQAMRPLNRLYGTTPAEAFGPMAFKVVRQSMIDGIPQPRGGRPVRWCRQYINKQCDRIKRMFKWAVSNELVPAAVYQGLRAVDGLKAGRSAAVESEPVRPVPIEHVTATMNHLSRHLRAMVELQLVTGMRPGELCSMRGVDLDTTGRLWLYKPATHKTQHHGHERTVYLGPRAIQILKPFLKPDMQAHIFSPIDAEAERREMMHEKRQAGGTPLSCGNKPGSNRQRRPKRAPGDRYDVPTYRRAIARACEAAFGMPAELKAPKLEKDAAGKEIAETSEHKMARLATKAVWHDEHVWHPHQLRHTAATELRKTHGLEAAQVILGHKTLTVTQIYAEKNVQAAMKIMAEVG